MARFRTGHGSTAGVPASPFDSNGSPFVGTGLSYMSSDNPMYDAYYRANPYVNQQYELTWFDKAFHGLFRTPYDKWLQEMQLNAAQYDASVVDLQQQNEYNSEVAQAQRMRDAGENPDLLGTEGVSDSAGLSPDVQDVQLPDAVQPMDAVANVANFAFQAIQSTFAILKDTKALKNLQLINDGQAIANDNALIAGGNSLEQLISNVVWKTTSPDSPPDPKVLSGSLERALSGIFTDKDMYNRASKVAQEFAAGLPQDKEAWKAWYERASSKAGYASFAGSEGYDEQMSDAMLSFYGFLRDMENQADIALKSLDISNSNEQIEYNDAHNATLEGLTDNAVNEANTAIAQRQQQEAVIAKAINDSFEKWTTALERKANSGERGSMWASIALGLIGLVRLTAMSGMSFGGSRRSSSFSGRTSGSSEASSFNFGF